MTEKTIREVWEELDEADKNDVYEMVGQKMENPKLTVEKIMAAKDILKWFTEEQKKLVEYILGETGKMQPQYKHPS